MTPIELCFDVACPPARAFELWTRRIGIWWPPGHTFSGDPGVEVVFEARPGGRIFERAADGTERAWGTVVACDPPARVAYRWHLMSDAGDATDVDVTFTPVGDHTTQVRIVHAGWERLGADATTRRARNRAGWHSVVPEYAAACVEGGT